MIASKYNKNRNAAIKVCNVNDFPILEEARQFINAIKSGVEKISLFHFADCFLGFSDAKQDVIFINN